MADYFHLVEQIMAEEKYLPLSRTEVQRSLELDHEFSFQLDHHTREPDGTESVVPIKLGIRAKDGHRAWVMTVLLHDIRVSCIDWEAEYDVRDDGVGRNWHRHGWDPEQRSCERNKIPLPSFDDVSSLEQFLIFSFSEMRISLNSQDLGEDHELWSN